MTDNYKPGRHFLQIPGPTNVPESVIRAMSQPVVDHRGPAFPKLTNGIIEKLKPVFKTNYAIFIYSLYIYNANEMIYHDALIDGRDTPKGGKTKTP